VRPAAATPAGSLELSAIDRVVGLRHMVPSLNVYPPRGCGAAAGEGQLQQQSPASVVREALGKALVDYYPLAGRLVDGPDGPASARVECTGEGAWFVEAVAGCSLEDVARLENYPFAIPEGDLLPDEAPGVQPLDLPLMMQVEQHISYHLKLVSSRTHLSGERPPDPQPVNSIISVLSTSCTQKKMNPRSWFDPSTHAHNLHRAGRHPPSHRRR